MKKQTLNGALESGVPQHLSIRAVLFGHEEKDHMPRQPRIALSPVSFNLIASALGCRATS